MTQFVSEAITLTLLSMVVGIIISLAAASPITSTLVKNSANSSTSQQENGATRGPRLIRNLGNNSVANVRNVQAAVGSDILAYGFGAAIAIAVIGSSLPAFMISKVRPSEVMRAD